jgi:hypothetical protein
MSGLTFNAMNSREEASIAERTAFFLKRTPEELYNFKEDPSALNNLNDDPTKHNVLTELQKRLENEMEKTNDPALISFKNRHDPEKCENYIKETEETLPKRVKKTVN